MVPAPVPRAPTDIGDLPEDILLRIMSHLTSRQAVHTCLVSPQWRYLWRSVPRINVSIEEFEGQHNSNNHVAIEEFEGEDDDDDDGMSIEEESQGEDDDDDGMSSEEEESEGDVEGDDEHEVLFKRFVNRLLELRNPVTLDEFHLRYSVSSNTRNMSLSRSRHANSWISYALQCDAQAVQVSSQYYEVQLLPAAFTSSSLNRLHIDNATLAPGFFNQLQMGCPALEYMFLHDCLIMDLEIFSSSLKVLIFSSEIRFAYDHGGQASISAPRLISLSMDYGISGARLPILTNMPLLKTASVGLCAGDIQARDADGIKQFLGGLCDVTTLDFYYWDSKLTMEKSFQWCPIFSKLTNLTLDCSFVNEDFYGLIVFLQNSPNLQKLTLSVDKSDTAIAGELEDRSFTCEQLQIVEIRCRGTSEMLSRVTQFLHANGIRHDQMCIVDRS
ncbi:hypothetical protein ACQ4PT_053328 [Festuca glaucescens]